MKPITDFSKFHDLDIRVGRVVNVEDSQTTKPTYRITVDFGTEVGIKKTCGAYRNYGKDDLLGKQVIGVLNLGTKQMGPEVSEFLMLGVPNHEGETIFLTAEREVELGVEVF
jgi:tRNA-binding protein